MSAGSAHPEVQAAAAKGVLHAAVVGEGHHVLGAGGGVGREAQPHAVVRALIVLQGSTDAGARKVCALLRTSSG